jgi:hypothetical protein
MDATLARLAAVLNFDAARCASNMASTDVLVVRREAARLLVCCSAAMECACARGRAVVAPNNSGKTTFARKNPDWLDQDVLLKREAGLGAKRRMTEDDMRAGDRVTAKHVERGDNVLVATWWDPKRVDAFVIIPEDELRRRGLAPDELHAATEQATLYRKVAREHRIPVYSSFEAASRALTHDDS